MSALPIPAEALEDCGIVLGKRGSGKSNSLMVLLEHELDAGHRSVMVDPKGDRWGIRMNPDKTPSRFSIPILGGDHGDRPVTEDMGRALAQLIAENDVSCLIDLSKLSLGAKQRFMMDFAPMLLERNRAPLTLFLEEVDQFANQDPRYQPPMLVHHMANFATLGRQRGIVAWMASQRPAKVNATLRSQADTFIGMKVVSPLDRDAFLDWFKGAGKDIAARVGEEVGSLGKGEAFVWVSEAGFFDRVQFPMATTYDSGRTPKHGETIDAVALPKLTNAAMLELLGAQVAAVPAAGAIGKTEAATIIADLAAARGERDQFEQRAHAAEAKVDELHGVIAGYQRAFEAQATLIADISWPSIQRRDGTMPNEPLVIAPVVPPKSEAPVIVTPRRSVVAPTAGASGTPSPAALAIADLLDRVNPARLTWTQAAAMTGRKASGGNFNTARRWLRDSGRIVEDGEFIRSSSEAPAGMSRSEAIDLWRSVLTNPAPRMIDAMLEHPSRHWSKEDLGVALDCAPRGGNFNNGLAQLRRNGLLSDVGGLFRLATPLPGERA